MANPAIGFFTVVLADVIQNTLEFVEDVVSVFDAKVSVASQNGVEVAELGHVPQVAVNLSLEPEESVVIHNSVLSSLPCLFSSSSSGSRLCSFFSLMHNSNVIQGDFGDDRVDISALNVVLTEVYGDPMFGSTRRDLARLREDFAIDLVEDGVPCA